VAISITLILRPREGDDRIEELLDAAKQLRKEGHHIVVRPTLHAGDAERFARAAARRHADVIVSAGGDGTLNEIVNGIGRCRTRPRIAVIPVGTANDFAAGVGLPESPTEGLRVAVEGVPTTIDLAIVNRRFFINVSTGGFGAQATETADPETKRKFGALAYLISGVKQFVAYRPARARFTTDAGVLYDGDFLVFAVGNSRQTGGGSRLTPRADLSDGKLDVVLVPDISRMDFLALLPDLRAGTHLDSPDVKYVQTRSLKVEAAEEISVNVDGEPVPGQSFVYGVHSQPIVLMLPADIDES
jgi:diacylglycerol kinase (ATP)